jgi:hypothetical protein
MIAVDCQECRGWQSSFQALIGQPRLHASRSSRLRRLQSFTTCTEHRLKTVSVLHTYWIYGGEYIRALRISTKEACRPAVTLQRAKASEVYIVLTRLLIPLSKYGESLTSSSTVGDHCHKLWPAQTDVATDAEWFPG